MFDQLLGNKNESKINSMYDIPFIAESKDPDTKLCSILLQNAYHLKNHDRVEAIKNGSYVDIVTMKDAKRYVAKILKDILLNNLRNEHNKIKQAASVAIKEQFALQVLHAPDVFYAAEICNSKDLNYGQGHF